MPLNGVSTSSSVWKSASGWRELLLDCRQSLIENS
jgi:hypothetical protein